jgi:membrane-associated phospholipid phosphatase
VLPVPWAITLALVMQAPGVSPQTPAPPPPAQQVWTDDQPFLHIFQNLAQDVRSLATPVPAEILAGGGLGAIIVHPLDDNLSTWANAKGSSSYTKIGDVTGLGYTHAAIALATYAIGKSKGHAEATHIGSDLIRAQILNGLITTGLKVTVNRTRPTGSDYSFPSGHSAATFATAAVLQSHYGWKIGGPMFALGGFVGWSRLRDNQHWISDVAFGSAIGIAVGESVTAGHRFRGWQIVPSKTAGGFAVYVTKTHAK